MSVTAGLMLQLYRRCLLIPSPMCILILEPSRERIAPLWDIPFLWASLIAQLVKNLQSRRPGFDPQVGKIPWGREWQPTQVFLPGESPGCLKGGSEREEKYSIYLKKQTNKKKTKVITFKEICFVSTICNR